MKKIMSFEYNDHPTDTRNSRVFGTDDLSAMIFIRVAIQNGNTVEVSHSKIYGTCVSVKEPVENEVTA